VPVVIETHTKRGRARELFAAFLGASAAAHAGVFVLLPGFSREPVSAPPVVLEVSIQPPALLPAAVIQPESVPTRRGPEPERRAAGEVPKTTLQPPPLLALSRPLPAKEAPLDVAPALLPEAQPGPAKPKSRGPNPPLTPPTFNAAYLSNPVPRYPLASRRSGEQGTVTLRVLVARDGAAARVKLERSSGSPHLDAAALEAVKAWRFTPARRGADAIESWMLVPIMFRLESSS
jgi:protein TonB